MWTIKAVSHAPHEAQLHLHTTSHALALARSWSSMCFSTSVLWSIIFLCDETNFLPSKFSWKPPRLSRIDLPQIPLTLEGFLILPFAVSHILYLYWREHHKVPCVRGISVYTDPFWGNGPFHFFLLPAIIVQHFIHGCTI